MSVEEQDSLEPAIAAVRHYIFLLLGSLCWGSAKFHPMGRIENTQANAKVWILFSSGKNKIWLCFPHKKIKRPRDFLFVIGRQTDWLHKLWKRRKCFHQYPPKWGYSGPESSFVRISVFFNFNFFMLYFTVKYVSLSPNGPISLLLNRNFQFLSYVSSYLEEWQYTATNRKNRWLL